MDKNIQINLLIKQFNESNVLAHNSGYVASDPDYNFKILDNAYAHTGKMYAKVKMAIESNKCNDPLCIKELEILKTLENAPQESIDFLSSVAEQLAITESTYYDVNQNYKYSVSNSVFLGKPGFSMSDGYNINLQIQETGAQVITFSGNLLEEPLIINSVVLQTLLDQGVGIVANTPDINSDMLRLVSEVGVLAGKSTNPETGQLLPTAKISEEFVLKNADGSYNYEIIDIGMGKGRNILKFDLDKIERKITPFIEAEVAGLLSIEQEVIAAWNVFISKSTSITEDSEMAQNANAGSSSWSYEKDLPLKQDKKKLFMEKYKEYFMNNYLKQFTTNQIPTVKADAAVFDLEEAKKAKAQKFIDDNKLA